MPKETQEIEVLTPVVATPEDVKVLRYFKARKRGVSKTKSALDAGYADAQHTSRIEKTKTYQQLESYYRNVLLDCISMEDIASINVRNMKQERDLGASNQALKIALDRIDQEIRDPDDEVVVIFRERD